MAAWLPAVGLSWAWANGQLTANPIQAATQRTGFTALTLLALSLACTPANSLLGFRPALKWRRPLGLYAFLYAAAHLLLFSGVDYGFNWAFLQDEVLEKPFIIVGLVAFTILLALAATSFQGWMKRLGKNWKRLHRLVYIAAPLLILHFAWARKGNLATLSGDILQPLFFGLAVGALLLLRLPAVRKALARGNRPLPRRPAASAEKVPSPPAAWPGKIPPDTQPPA